ncbi:glycerophosphoryl diester phosphodiesterase [Alteribacillus persepolensis]|uniref:Glycerophosphoryl diester phosphodiesterase n=1 Tax=Alteribacillus persepolensis TaxID=568899 RepID=A0A1G8EGP4_9BACI|nr:glycerophosphodiester phosphodiesterase family protein [Alteribacillus persepolensis]SDH69031.1 glycerophosphoryl diester phosphodiesterase [Alteribacillus persepolensis]
MKLRYVSLTSLVMAAAIVSSTAAPQPISAEAKNKQHVKENMSFEEIHTQLLNHKPNAPLMITAHRGQWREYPENSIAAINEAIRDGAEIVEIDVRLTADGVPVLMHDDTVDRTTDGEGKVSDYTLEEIKELRLKENLGGEDAALTEYKVPTLREAMLAAKGHAIVNLDKGWNIREEMYDVLVDTDTVDHGLFKGSPNVEEAAKFMAEDPDILYMHIINDDSADTVDAFPGRQPVAYEVVFDELTDPQVQPEKVRQIQENSRVFMNVMWDGLAYTYTDEASLRDDKLGWKAVEKLGATIMQTDNVEALNYWRNGGNMKFWNVQQGNRTIKVQAEDYVTYSDADSNSCDESAKDGIDVCNIDGAIVVSDNKEGEWAKYKVNVQKSGMYQVSGRLSAAGAPEGTVSLYWGDGESIENIDIKNTTHNRAFEMQDWGSRYFEKGTHTIMVDVTDSGSYHLDYIQFDLER